MLILAFRFSFRGAFDKKNRNCVLFGKKYVQQAEMFENYKKIKRKK